MNAPVTIESSCPFPLQVELVEGGPKRPGRLRMNVTPGGLTVLSWELEDWHTREPLTNRLARHSFTHVEGLAKVAARRWLESAMGVQIGDPGPSRPAVQA